MPVDVVVGMERGDEGKGRVISDFMPDYDIGARPNGGSNAGHEIVLDGEIYYLHALPSSILFAGKISVIGNGCVLNPASTLKEMAELRSQGIEITPQNLHISDHAHVTLPTHIDEERARELGERREGSTLQGIGPTYGAKGYRKGLQLGQIDYDPQYAKEIVLEEMRLHRMWLKMLIADGREELEKLITDETDDKERAAEFLTAVGQLTPFMKDTVEFFHQALSRARPARVLAEGAQGAWLDIDHGMYPYVTSSSTVAGAASTGLGLGPTLIDSVIGVAKAVPSHVGGGTFVTQFKDKELDEQVHGDIEAVDGEKGKTTGRRRGLGYVDLPKLRRAVMLNGGNGFSLFLTKLDWVNRIPEDELKVCEAYDVDGCRYKVAPTNAEMLRKAEPVYREVAGWTDDISGVRCFEDLPRNAQNFVLGLEADLGVPIKHIGVGPARGEIIVR